MRARRTWVAETPLKVLEGGVHGEGRYARKHFSNFRGGSDVNRFFQARLDALLSFLINKMNYKKRIRSKNNIIQQKLKL